MNIHHAAACLRSTADALERCVDGVPEGFKLECKDKLASTWIRSTATHSDTMNVTYYHYRLVPLSQEER